MAMPTDKLSPAQRLRRTIRMLNNIQLGPHGHGDVSVLKQGSLGGPYGTFGPGELLPGGHAIQERPVGAAPASAGGTFGVAAANLAARQAGQPMPAQPQTPASIAQHLFDLQHSGGSQAEIQAGAASLAQLLRRRGRSRSGHARAAAAGGKPVAPVGGRPYLP